MTAVIRRDNKVAQFLKSASASIVVLVPSLIAGMYLMDNRLPLQEPFIISYLILILSAINLALVIMMEPYRRDYCKMTSPALASVIAVVLLFAMTESLNRFYLHLGYNALTPFVIACLSLVYMTIVLEKSIVMKLYLSLNSVSVMALWALGSIDKFTMPF